ncbi:hypothetical protein BGZ97_010519 [Linnemannia gamsii]|uniref:Uncharacterized protein n=1 Tax=Linnemannia gamsii TaxID=64522 RepID=A0A9P6R5F3_9FUNG|nr:hypothetical protein BGZ97_010519 [Linnemannia gamsii]
MFESADEGFDDYLERNGLASQYLVEAHFDHNDGEIDRPHKTAKYTVRSVAARQLRRDLTWALCAADVERVRTLVIPLSDITRYLPLVGRFTVLEDITFVLDHDIPEDGGHRYDNMTEEQKGLVKRHWRERIQHLEDMITFVQEHRRQHCGMLADGQCLKEYQQSQECPREYQLRLLYALPPLINPRCIGLHNWVRFVHKAQDIDLSHVKTFRPPSSSRWNEIHLYNEKSAPIELYLPRCRSLDTFMTNSINDNTFQWAVDERRQYNADIAAGRRQHRPSRQQSPLVPLRYFTIKDGQLPTRRQLSNIAFAFHDTLEMIIFSGSWEREDDDQESLDSDGINGDNNTNNSELSSWSLPRLLRFDAVCREHYSAIKPDFLSHCPRLTFLNISDGLAEYTADGVEYWKPAELPLLNFLNLRGASAYLFHPDTLKSTPELTHLYLGSCFGSPDQPIPPPENIISIDADDDDDDFGGESATTITPNQRQRRPIWTWDWELPKLTSLQLDSEFAHAFRFRMLASTPSLESLVLNIVQECKRTIRLADLLLPKPGFKTHHPPLHVSDNEKEEVEYIHALTLRSFALSGTWILDSQVMKVLFSKVIPNISALSLNTSQGFSLEEWVNLTSNHLHHLERATLEWPTPSAHDLSQAGLTKDTTSLGFRRDYQLVKQPLGRVLDSPANYSFSSSYNQYHLPSFQPPGV